MKAPTDERALAIWTDIMKLAEDYALIIEAGGGVAILATPENQREAGLRDKALFMAGFDKETKSP